jgi:hypothetical protein
MVCVQTAPGFTSRSTEATNGSSAGQFLQALGEIVLPYEGGTVPVRGQSTTFGEWNAQGTAVAKTE